MATNLPEMAKSETCGEARSTRTRGAIRGDWGGRAPKDRSRYLGDPMQRLGSSGRARAGAPWLQVAACGEKGAGGTKPSPSPSVSGNAHGESITQRRRQSGVGAA